jgi:hypothetical protein
MNIDQVVGRRKVRLTPDFLRRARKCCICRHPRREEIESDYLVWRNPRQIMGECGLAHHDAIYRHAHATGLASRRRENAYSVLDSIVEQVDDVQVTGSIILRAMRAYSCLTSKGRWINPQNASSTKSPLKPHPQRTPHMPTAPDKTPLDSKTARRHKVTRRS